MSEELIRKLPFSLTTEQALLGSLIVNPDAINEVVEMITPTDFYLEEHMHIFSTVKELFLINKKIDFGGTFVYASGTPFTAPNRFYMLNGNIISEYGKHNANRLSPYIRLDLSINYDIINNNDKKAGVNISIYNALMRENEIYYRLDISQKRFAYRSFSFFAKILPSISFYYSF